MCEDKLVSFVTIRTAIQLREVPLPPGLIVGRVVENRGEEGGKSNWEKGKKKYLFFLSILQ